MKKLLLLSLLCGVAFAALYLFKSRLQPTTSVAAAAPKKADALPDDAIFTYPPAPAQALEPVIGTAELTAYLGTMPQQVQAAAKTRNVVFMHDCLPAIVDNIKQFSMEGQHKGLTMGQLQDNNNAFIHKIVADLREKYDLSEAEEHKNDPKNPATGKSFKEEAEIYQCGLSNYLPLFKDLMATRPAVTILTQPDLVNVFMVLPDSYRSLGVSRMSKTLQSGVYTLVFTKPGYQSVRKTFAAQSTPVQVFKVALPALASQASPK